jgi:assimilatory nitrate reductase catalytic subunit
MRLFEYSENPNIVFYENRQDYLLRTGQASPRFLQGIFPFVGKGLFDLSPLDDTLTYTVPEGKSAHLIYFRAGNHSNDLLYLIVAANGTPIRYFPIGPKSDLHVPLAIVEAHPAGTTLAILFAAPRGLSGSLILDVGIIEERQE